MQTAEANKSTVILANDPDADRLALAEKQPKYVQKVLVLCLTFELRVRVKIKVKLLHVHCTTV